MGLPGKKRKAPHWEQPNLKRFRKAVESLSTSPQKLGAPTHHTHHDPSTGGGTGRKQKRKQERILKKMRKLAFKQGKPLPTITSLAKERQEKEQAARAVSQAAKKKKNAQRRQQQRKQRKEKAAAARQAEFEAARKQDDKLLHQLERQLGLHKRKSKGLPTAFTSDGLDYILDVVDPDKKQALYGIDGGDEEDEVIKKGTKVGEDEEEGDILMKDNEDDQGDMLSGDDSNEEESENEESEDEEINEEDNESEDDEYEDEDESKSEETEEKGSESEESQDEDSEEESSEDDDKPEEEDADNDELQFKEDIYGKLRDHAGNVVDKTESSKEGSTYVPPARRMTVKEDGKTKARLLQLKRQLKGQLNRVSEANLASVSHQLETVFRESSRAEASEILADLLLDTSTSGDPVPERIMAEQTFVLAVLHNNIGCQVGATVLQLWAQQFHKLLQLGGNYGSNKEMDNLLVLLCNLYNFKVAHSVLVFDVITKFSSSFSARDVDLLLTILKNVGPLLRKEEPNKLREAILVIQDQAAKMESSQEQETSRVKFMLEILMAIRNNNLRKIPSYDPSHLERLMKLLRPLICVGGRSGEGPLRVTLPDLLEAEKRGRWWLVGSAWSGQSSEESSKSDTKSTSSSSMGITTELLELARKQRMNTDVRRNIFCLLMTSEDFVEAFERLLQLGLTRHQEPEIIHVLLDLCLQEQKFNPFYAYLAQKLCEFNRRFQLTVQTSVRERLSGGTNLGTQQTNNLARLLDHLITTRSSSLALFKVLDFGALDRQQVRLLKSLLHHLLVDHDEETICNIFTHIAASSKLQLLRDGLKLFMTHFLLRPTKSDQISDREVLRKRVVLAQRALLSAQSRTAL